MGEQEISYTIKSSKCLCTKQLNNDIDFIRHLIGIQPKEKTVYLNITAFKASAPVATKLAPIAIGYTLLDLE